MDFLERVLGIQVSYQDDITGIMPNYIYDRYRIQKVELDGKAAVFVFPKCDLDAVSLIQNHMNRIEKAAGVSAVLILDKTTYRQREALLQKHIPFIVNGKQIYLPFLAVYLQEKCDAENKINDDSLLPSSEVLLLYFIYHGCREMFTSDAARSLNFTPTSISRASRQLEDAGLINAEKKGSQKIIYSDKAPEELFHDAEMLLPNPVKRTIYVPRSMVISDLPVSGYTALSEYSMLNPSQIITFATDSISEVESSSSNKIQDIDNECAIELWRYDPNKLSDGKIVDRLSLALTLRNNGDERTQEAVEEMLDQVWREINDTWN